MQWIVGAEAAGIKHVCKPMLIASNCYLAEKARSTSVLVMQEKSPSYLKDIVNLWTEKRVALVAIEVPNSHSSVPPPSNSNQPETPNDHIRIANPRNPNTSISLQISKEKTVQLNPCISPGTPRHWSIRAMQNKQTTLSDIELQEFLNLVQNATFAIFNINLFDNEVGDDISNNSDHHEFLSNGRGQQKYRDKLVPIVRSFFMYLTCNESEELGQRSSS